MRGLGGGEVFVVPSQPPSIIAGPAVDGQPATLRFRLGRALELARPPHVLLATLPSSEGSALLDAVAAAFGPSDTTPTVSRDAAALASELWRTMPSGVQRDVRDLLVANGGGFGFEPIRDAIHGAAARAGLLAAGQIQASIHALRMEEPELGLWDVSSEHGFSEACKRSPSLAELVRFTLSDTFLAACGRAGLLRD